MSKTVTVRTLAACLVLLILLSVYGNVLTFFKQARQGAVRVSGNQTLVNKPLVQHDSVASKAFLETFDGNSASSQPWNPPNWDVAVHSRDKDTWYKLEPMEAQHTHDCAPPPATHHFAGEYENAVFHCKNHVMTAIKAEGYGLIALTPNHMVDFSQGEAVIKFDVSTLRTSSRDWIDVWITPYEDNLQLPFESDETDLAGPPRNAVQILLGDGSLRPIIYRNFQDSEEFTPFSDTYNWYIGYESFLTPSSQRRDTFEIRISRTHLKAGMPAYNFWWIDKDIRDLGWSRGIVQFEHHSYNPEKDCNIANQPGPDGRCVANTWHWDNISISPSAPFTMIKADKRYVNYQWPNFSTDEQRTVTFAQPAPANAYLRFSGIGTIQASFDDGAWQNARKQPSGYLGDGRMTNYWMPIPEGARHVTLRFSPEGWYDGPFIAKDFAIWSTSVSSEKNE